MKKIMLFAAACAALAACNKNIESTTPKLDNPNAFVKGQEVTLTVSESKTKATGYLNASDGVDFKWDEDDQIKVTVGTESSTFTLKSGAGEATASFEGTMPSGGETFSVQYPATDPDLSSQSYVENGLPKGMMKATASNCTINGKISLVPQYAALRLNFYGLNREVSKIVVTNTTANPNVSYTLNCSTAVRVGNSAETATPFLLVVEPGASAWNFKVNVTASEATTNLEAIPTYSDLGYEGSGIVIPVETFSTSSEKTFTKAQVLNMPAQSIAPVWAPVNCGYVAKTGDSGEDLGYPYGKLYQWGRKYGQGYGLGDYQDATYPTVSNGNQINFTNAWTTHPDDTDANKDKFYWKSLSNWYVGGGIGAPDANSLWGTSKTAYDPCPAGWRVPALNELVGLSLNHSTTTIKDGLTGIYYSGSTTYSESAPRIFLPTSGHHSGNDGIYYDRTVDGFYWTSETYESTMSYCLRTGTRADIGFRIFYRTYDFSVRCIKE